MTAEYEKGIVRSASTKYRAMSIIIWCNNMTTILHDIYGSTVTSYVSEKFRT